MITIQPRTPDMGEWNAGSIGRLLILRRSPISMPRRRGLGCAVCAWETAERQIGEHVTRERRYYVMSLAGNAQAFGCAVRTHWGIENGLHWVLDLAFEEDRSRIRKNHSQQNFFVLRHLALNLANQQPTPNFGTKARHLNPSYIAH